MMKLPSLLFLAVSTAVASADITYIDAVEGASGNTFATGSTLADTSWTTVATTGTDSDQWAIRTPFGNEGTIFQSWHSSTTMPELTTKITGLVDGDYDVWVFFWDQPSPQKWNISAGLTSGNLTTYGTTSPLGPGNTTAAVRADSLTFTNTAPAVITTEAPARVMYGVNLGQVTVSEGSDINVFVDNLEAGGSALRTWYDGVGYAPAAVITGKSVAITSFTSIGGDVWEVVLTGEPATTYQFRSAADLVFEPGVLVEGLTQGDPGDAGTIDGTTSGRLTTDAQGIGVARMTLTGTANFVRAETLPPS